MKNAPVSRRRIGLFGSSALGVIATLALAAPAAAIVPNDNVTPTEAIDNDGGVNGVGMFYRNDGFVCSGTLINPRTVLFAAHCVNDRPQEDYGDVVRAAFSFDVNALPGFQFWLRNGFASNPDLFVYNISQIRYHPGSLARPEAQGFLEADIALATLSDPVTTRLDPNNLLGSTIPTWALLFSPLPTPSEITQANGTGYHVSITGYGRSGSGTFGATQGIDWRRRAAENMLGGLASLDDVYGFLFGDEPGTYPQVLYQLDFDDPDNADIFDFNIFRDEPLEREGTTAGGDSGGPLILDAANNNLSTENLQIGVLSGGSRYFGPQPFSSYGTNAFYQPLFLFWDYIAATSPYRYVSAKAGNGAWEDGAHWQTDLDPAFRVIDANGAVVNGIPTAPGAGATGDTPKFGQVCFQSEFFASDICQDVNTGELIEGGAGGNAASTDLATSNIGRVDTAALTLDGAATDGTVAAAGAAAGTGMVRDVARINAAASVDGQTNSAIGSVAANDLLGGIAVEAQDSVTALNGEGSSGAVLPAPTLANGLPGATGFVPDNVEPAAGSSDNARYFDVTLAATGITTLDSDVTIDRLTVRNAAQLHIRSAGDLTSNIDIGQYGGVMRVDGRLTTFGDYLLLGGVLSGTGVIQTPFLTSVAGVIAPGATSTTGTIGTLTVDGNMVMSSGTLSLFDLGANGVSDQLRVNPMVIDTETGARDATGQTGNINVGGNVILNLVAGFDSFRTNTYRIVESTRPLVIDNGTTPGEQTTAEAAANPLTGTFAAAAPLSAILQSSFIYGANFVDVRVAAQSYLNVVTPANQVQTSYGRLMDQNRGNEGLRVLFNTLDFVPDAATIRAVFDSWAPTTETTIRTLGGAMLSHVQQFHDNRLANASRSANGGTVATLGQPLQLAAASAGGYALPGSPAIMTDAVAAAADATPGTINENFAVYLAGGYVDGDGQAMPLMGVQPRSEDFDGYFIAGGIEAYLGERSLIGGSVYYSDLEADATLGHAAEGQMLTGTLYGQLRTAGNIVFDAQVGVGRFSAATERNVTLGMQSFRLTTDDDSTAFHAAAGIGYEQAIDSHGLVAVPNVELRYQHVNFGTVSEAGGGPALTIVREDYKSLQGRAGLDLRTSGASPLQALISADVVHQFNSNDGGFGANFVGGTGGLVPFAIAGNDSDWGEVGVGLRYTAGAVTLGVNADFSLGRADIESNVYSGSVTVRF